MCYTQLTQDGHIVLPAELLEKARLQPGAEVIISETEEGLKIEVHNPKPPLEFIDSLVGKYRDVMPSMEEYHEWKAEDRAIDERQMNRH